MSLLSFLRKRDPVSTTKPYRSEDGSSYFMFSFVWQGNYLDIYCLSHPPLNGRDPDPDKTYVFSDGKICVNAGREPRDQARAEALAQRWAEHFLEYRRTGIAQH